MSAHCNVRTTQIIPFLLVIALLILAESSSFAQGTGNIWITDINNQSQVINGYRHNVDIEGTEIFIDGEYEEEGGFLFSCKFTSILC